MRLSGLHLLLTYRCTYECDHCFVWSGPGQSGTLSLAGIRAILDQAESLGGVEWIYFEGGEPFLYYAALKRSVEEAASRGFKVGLVSNGYWATAIDDAEECLRPFEGLVQELSISSDRYHGSDKNPGLSENARVAAERFQIPCSLIRIAEPEAPAEGSRLMFRGRAAKRLASRVEGQAGEGFDTCPHEELREPDRVHIDPLGHVHLCQGISLGNVFETSLSEICARYDPDRHPVVGPLVDGGPAELARRHGLPVSGKFADACHMCDTTRRELRPRYPRILTPDQVYGDEGSPSS